MNRLVPAGAAVLLMAAAAVVGTPTPSAAAPMGLPSRVDDPITFGVQTSGPKKPDQRPNFSYSATAGATMTDHIAVANYTNKAMAIRVYASDAFNTANGGYDVLPANRKPVDVGSWITLARTQLTVPAKKQVIVPFTLKVPAGATPGDHAGGVVASVTTQTTDAAGNQLAVDQRVGLRVYLRVPGDLVPRLSVDDMHVTYTGTLNPFGQGRLRIGYTVRNTGNVRLSASQAVRLGNLFGTSLRGTGFAALPELLPGNSYTVEVPVSKVMPALRSSATVTLDPKSVPGSTDSALNPASGKQSFWAVPWTLLAGLGVVILAVLVLTQRTRMRLLLRRRTRLAVTA